MPHVLIRTHGLRPLKQKPALVLIVEKVLGFCSFAQELYRCKKVDVPEPGSMGRQVSAPLSSEKAMARVVEILDERCCLPEAMSHVDAFN